MFKKSVPLIFFFVLISAIVLSLVAKNYQVKESTHNEITLKHSSQMDDPKYFVQAFGLGKDYLKIENKKVYGGIVPHHLLASPLIAAFFEGLKNQKVDRVILLSPNHFMTGKNNISTSKAKFSTVYGDLYPDIEKVDLLNKKKIAIVDEDVFSKEHGIFGLTTFIKAIFPEALFIPITVKGGTSKEELDSLANELNKLSDEKTLVVVSSDFSHYLTSTQANEYDKESISVIKSYDLDKTLALHHEKNTDSPESLYTLLKIMKLKKATKSSLLVNSNSAKLSNENFNSNTTSYVTMYFTKE